MTPAAVSASTQAWLAGNPGRPPSPASVAITLAILALTFAAFVAGTWPRRHREAPLRTQMRARTAAVTFRASVDAKADTLGVMLSARGRLDLIMRGDAFEVSHPFSPARFVFGQEYCYRAQDTTVTVVPGLRHDWIEIEGQPARTAARIWIGRKNQNRQIWDALVDAGSHPIGSPPPS